MEEKKFKHHLEITSGRLMTVDEFVEGDLADVLKVLRDKKLRARFRFSLQFEPPNLSLTTTLNKAVKSAADPPKKEGV